MFTRISLVIVVLAMLSFAVLHGRPVSVLDSEVAAWRGHDPSLAENVAPDLTAVVLVAGLKSRDLSSKALPRVETGLKCIKEFLLDDSARAPDDRETFLLSFALMALKESNHQGEHDQLIKHTIRRLKNAQWSPTRDCSSSNPKYGGTGYKSDAPPDLYHTSLAIEALREAGVPSSDVYMQRALEFVTSCQCDSSESTRLSSEQTDGGFSIVPARLNLIASRDMTLAEDDCRPCGSLTCAGLKSLIHCGVMKEDSRVQAAMHWLSSRYTVDANPGMPNPRRRLYDYYRSFATAMTLLDVDVVVDADNVKHDWRRELIAVIQAKQQRDGSWTNSAEAGNLREAHPLLTTSYAMITLHEIVSSSSGR